MDELQVRGGKELLDNLAKLPDRVAKNITLGALRAGGKVFRDLARTLVHSVSGKLAKSLRVIKRRTQGDEMAVAIIAGGTGKKDDAYYASMVEFGTAPHRIDPRDGGALQIGSVFAEKAYHPGASPHPYMRPALDRGAQGATDAVADYIRKRLDLLTKD